jgi:hypothetical protein
VSLRARLTLWFLVLAIVPSLLLSALVLRQLVQTVEWWDSAGAEEALTSSVVVAKNALQRLETGLHLSASPLFELSRSRELALGPGQPDRQFVERYLENTGLDLYQLYRRAPGDSAWTQTVDIAPIGRPRRAPLDLAPELDRGRIDPMRPVQSTTGVFGLLVPLPTDSTHATSAWWRSATRCRRIFPQAFELQLGIGTFRALAGYAGSSGGTSASPCWRSLPGGAGRGVRRAHARAAPGAADRRPGGHVRQVDGGTEVSVVPHGSPEVGARRGVQRDDRAPRGGAPRPGARRACGRVAGRRAAGGARDQESAHHDRARTG